MLPFAVGLLALALVPPTIRAAQPATDKPPAAMRPAGAGVEGARRSALPDKAPLQASGKAAGGSAVGSPWWKRWSKKPQQRTAFDFWSQDRTDP